MKTLQSTTTLPAVMASTTTSAAAISACAPLMADLKFSSNVARSCKSHGGEGQAAKRPLLSECRLLVTKLTSEPSPIVEMSTATVSFDFTFTIGGGT